MFFVDASKRRVSGDARIGKHNIEIAFFVLDPLEEAIQVRKICYICLYARDVAPNQPFGFIQLRLRPSSDKDVSPFLHEAFGRGEPDATAAAGDEGDFSV